jgi:hypothetical protein
MPGEYTVGQPKSSSTKKRGLAKEFYQLGRSSAALDQKKKDVEQETMMSLAQRIMLQNAQIDLKDLIAELKRSQEDVMAKQAMAAMPPMLPEMPGQGLPMLPEPPTGMQGGGPPMMGGPPPDIMPVGGQGGPLPMDAAPPMF